ncbi:hypothetical protein NIES4074_64850 (plasmid) [Cylindrospermum sp. NIES-4074]|nr:hypothetical protein NIES4074_64850 [Cylindrospermum sp. NIES-4074]
MSNFIFTSFTNKSQCGVTLVGVASFVVLSQNSFLDLVRNLTAKARGFLSLRHYAKGAEILVTTSLELPHLNNYQKKVG